MKMPGPEAHLQLSLARWGNCRGEHRELAVEATVGANGGHALMFEHPL